MVRALTWTASGAGLTPALSYILFTKVDLVVSKKYIIYNKKCYLLWSENNLNIAGELK